MFTLPQSLVVQPHDNCIPSFDLKIEFVDGYFAQQTYSPSNSNALWSLVAASANLCDAFFFEISRQVNDLKFQGHYRDKRFCLFCDTYDASVELLGSPHVDLKKSELVEFYDGRWETVYFIPDALWTSFDIAVEVGTRVLQSGDLGETTTLSQTFEDLGLPSGYR